jgi:hypothetical protein
MNSETPNEGSHKRQWAGNALLELLEAPSTCTALVILVLATATLLFSLRHDLTVVPW